MATVKQETLNRILEHGGRMQSALLEIIDVTNDVEITENSVNFLIEKLSQCREIAIAAFGGIDGMDEPTCRVCGCTDDFGCIEGCWWVEPGLCSRCDGETAVSEE